MLGALARVSVSSSLFAFANWLFLDACIRSARRGRTKTPRGEAVPALITYVDWLPGVCSIIGFFGIALIDKDPDPFRGFGFDLGASDSQARSLPLFLCFSLMASGLLNSVTVLVLKYLMSDVAKESRYYGYANIGQNVLLMLSAAVLWES
ncbi:UPF0220-domain-containing protein [Mycena sanguinolenta]|uniref:UPF0220-domain-containing protein n=1 Tax=Mycena sanguinolenta TaxID=230812 RepID=A0A8H7CQC9_9AGAR|nr:UPF0220-domain-containing protein [Mycena sanguinolenta]